MANGAILGQSTTTWTNNQILSSVSAALYSLGANATPDQVFAAIRPLITTAQNTANNARSAANTAQQTANNAINDAEDAQNTANNALNVANGNAKIVTGSYVGNGKYGVDNPVTLSFSGDPKLVVISGTSAGNNYSNGFAVLVKGVKLSHINSILAGDGNKQQWNGSAVVVTWGTNKVSFYSSSSAAEQLNTNNASYYYVTLI